MPFLVRARTIYERGDSVATAIALVEGLKRHPGNTEAFRWLLDIYCHELPHTGLEEDLVGIFDACPDPEGVYRYVFRRLGKSGRERFIRRLDRARRDSAARRGLFLQPWEELLEGPPVEAEAPVLEEEAEVLAYTAAAAVEMVSAYADSGVTAMGVAEAFREQRKMALSSPKAPPRPSAPAKTNSGLHRSRTSLPLSSVSPRSSVNAWESDVHPLLLGRQNYSGEVRAAAAEAPEAQTVAPTPRKQEPLRRVHAQAGFVDLDAVRAFEEGSDQAGGWGGGYRPRARAEKPKKRRRVLKLVLALLALGLVALAVTRLITVAERRHAISGSSSALAAFGPEMQKEAEEVLAQAVADDPTSVELAGRLRWTRSLQRIVTAHAAGVELPDAAPEEGPGGERTAWFVAADSVEALRTSAVEDAAVLLVELESAPGVESFPEDVMGWLRAELHLARGDLKVALDTHQKQASNGFVPSIVAALDIHMRRGDILSARRAFEGLKKTAPDHIAVKVGDAALTQLHRLIKDPRAAQLQTPEGLTVAELREAVADSRLTAWVVLASPEYARERGIAPDMSTHPVLKLVYARQMIGEGKVEDIKEAFAVLEGGASNDLQDAEATMLSGGFAQAGRPDLALERVPKPEQKGEVGAEIFVKKNPSVALVRASLLADMGRYAESRALLMRILSHSKMTAEARVVALQMHLNEGRVEDVERHIERLKDHRGALVAAAALDLYRNRPESAVAKLGPASPSSLPDESAAPYLRRFEVRVRLLTLKVLGHHEQAGALLKGVEVSPALQARILGPEKGSKLRARVLAAEPTSVNDLLDLAMASLEAGDVVNARRSAKKIRAAVPTHTEAHRIEGRALLSEGQGKLAAQHLQAATRGRDEQPDMTLVMAEAMFHAGQKIRAIHALRAHLDKSPHDAKAIALLGETYLNTRRMTMGREDLGGRYNRISPKRHKAAAGEAAFQLARLNGITQGNDKAYSWLTKAKRLLGERPDIVLAEADFLRFRGDKKRALVLYQRVSELPGAPNRVHLSLGKVALKRGRHVLAKTAFERYLKDASEGESATWARSQVAKLEGL